MQTERQEVIASPGESSMASDLTLGWLRLTTAGALPAVFFARAEKAQIGRRKSSPREGTASNINGSAPAPAQWALEILHPQDIA